MNAIADPRQRLAESFATAQARVNGGGKPVTLEASDLDAINRNAVKPMAEDEFFAFEFELSNSNVDAYSTRMTQESLENYARRINDHGVPLQPNHDSYSFPIGRIYASEVIRTDDGVQRLLCRAYIVRGDDNGAGLPSGDSLIRKIETGVQKDVSIGFVPGGYTCSACGGEMSPGYYSRAEGQCDHVPGLTYDGKVCYAWVEDAIILEGSLVYTGATPQAIIKKAVNAFKAGTLDARQVNTLTRALHITNLTEDTPMLAKEILKRVAGHAATPETLKRSLEAQAETVAADAGEDEAVRILAEQSAAAIEAGNEQLKQENARLAPLAALAETVKTRMIAETLAEGVRALGNDFDAAKTEEMLKGASFDTIEVFKNQYGAMVRKIGTVNVSEDSKTELDKPAAGAKLDRIDVSTIK